MSKYNCKCGFGTDDAKEWRVHLIKGRNADGVGIHGRALEPINDKESIVTAPPPGLIAAIEEEEAKIKAAVAAREVKREAATVVKPPVANTIDGKNTPVETSQEYLNPTKLKRRRSLDKKQWLLLMLGILLAVLGGVLVFAWLNDPRNQFLGLLALIGLAGGFYLIYTQLFGQHRASITSVIVTPGKKKAFRGPPNCVNIYIKRDAFGRLHPYCIVFEFSDSPLGQPWQCLNDGKYYYIQVCLLPDDVYEPLLLPDAKYTSPGILGTYIELPAQRRYFRPRESLMKYLGPGMLAVMNCVGFVVIIILAG